VKYLVWLLKAAIFFVLFAFALNNQGAVKVNLFFGAHWYAPLVLVLLVVLVLGVGLGVLVMLPLWWRARKTAKQVLGAPAAAPSQPTDTPPDTPPHGI
jgi:uncharacterized integral membrane protein